MSQPNSTNNFDLIRLMAAIQVFVGHGFLFGFIHCDWLYKATWFIPGVPVFFGMSGFLLLWSLERNPDWRTYCKNRMLRLFPALWVAVALSLVILLWFGTLSWHDLRNPGVVLYFVGRCTIVYYFVPQIIRRWALGNPNGSLWTIGVELQFYALLPVVFFFLRGYSRAFWNIVLVALGVVSYWIDRSDPALPFAVQRLNGYVQILISEFRIFYFLFFFILGMLFYVNYGLLRRVLEGKFLLWLGVYVVACLLTLRFCDLSAIDRYAPDPISLGRHVLLLFLVFSAAFSNGRLAERLLRGNDYSYGIYLFHLLMLNTFFAFHRFEGWVCFGLAGLATAALAFLSWHFVEKPALRLKKRSLRYRALKFVKLPL